MSEGNSHYDVLIIDDDPENRDILKLRLEAAGYSVAQARDGLEGQDLAKTFVPGLIILDCMMPKADGWQTCQSLKADSRTKHIPVVMLTALSQNVDALRSWEAGVDDFLTKPCDHEMLLAVVKKYLTKS